MPAKSQQQAKLIFAKRGQYGTKANAPEEWKWVFDKEWTDDLEMKKLPKKVEETKIRNMIREILFEEIDLEKGFSDEPEEEDYELDMLKHGSAMQIQEKNMKLKKLLEDIDIFNDDKPQKISEEQRSQVMEFIKNFNANNETVYREANLSKFAKKLEIVGKIAEQMLVNESEDWFDTVSLKRDCKGLSEAIKVFSQTANEVSSLQQRLESAYEDVGTKLGKYFEIAGLEDQDPEQERNDLTEASYKHLNPKFSKDGYVKQLKGVSGKLAKEIHIDGKNYRYNSVYKTYNSVKGNELLHKNDLEKAKQLMLPGKDNSYPNLNEVAGFKHSISMNAELNKNGTPVLGGGEGPTEIAKFLAKGDASIAANALGKAARGKYKYTVK